MATKRVKNYYISTSIIDIKIKVTLNDGRHTALSFDILEGTFQIILQVGHG